MAFTSEGMFYLGKEDLAPTIGLAGTGVRGMLGLQNKKEAVDSIMQSGDFSTEESRRSILEQIRAVDSTAYQKYAKENQEWEARELGLQEKRNKPVLETEWRLDVGKKVTNNWATSFLGLSGLTTRSDIVKYLNGQVQSKAMTSGARSSSLKDYDKFMKEKKTAYLTTNAYTKPSSKVGTIASGDVFGSGAKGSKLTPFSSLEGLDVTGLEAKRESYLQELKSLPALAQQAFAANPAGNAAISKAHKERQEALHKLINEIGSRVDKQSKEPFNKEAKSIFDTNALKYSK